MLRPGLRGSKAVLKFKGLVTWHEFLHLRSLTFWFFVGFFVKTFQTCLTPAWFCRNGFQTKVSPNSHANHFSRFLIEELLWST